MEDEGKSSLGFEEGVVAAASYFCFLGLIIFVLEKRSHFVRFHALQSAIGFALLFAFWLTVKLVDDLFFLRWAPGLLALVLSVYMMIRAYDGEEFKLPIIGNLAFSAVYHTGPEVEDYLVATAGDSDNSDISKGG